MIDSTGRAAHFNGIFIIDCFHNNHKSLNLFTKEFWKIFELLFLRNDNLLLKHVFFRPSLMSSNFTNVIGFLEAYFINPLDWRYLRWLGLLYRPLIICFLLPVVVVLLLYGTVLILLVAKWRHKIRESYHYDTWRGTLHAATAVWMRWSAVALIRSWRFGKSAHWRARSCCLLSRQYSIGHLLLHGALYSSVGSASDSRGRSFSFSCARFWSAIACHGRDGRHCGKLRQRTGARA